jgi:hypothetical protein
MFNCRNKNRVFEREQFTFDIYVFHLNCEIQFNPMMAKFFIELENDNFSFLTTHKKISEPSFQLLKWPFFNDALYLIICKTGWFKVDKSLFGRLHFVLRTVSFDCRPKPWRERAKVYNLVAWIQL